MGGAVVPADAPNLGVDSRDPLPSDSPNDAKLALRGSGPDDCRPVARY